PSTWTRPVPTATVGGGTVNFVIPAGTSVTSSPALSNGIIGGYATIGTGPSPTDWATVAGGQVVPLPAASYTNDTWATTNNTTVTTGSTAAGTVTNSLRFNTPGAFTVTFSAAHTINQG